MNARSPNQIDQHVGARLRLRRSHLDMSQLELGEKLGVTFQQVQKYERGTNRVGASRLFCAGKVLGVQVGYFYEGLDPDGDPLTETREDADAMYDFIASPDGLDLARAFAGINDQTVRRRFVDLARAMAAPVDAEATLTDAEVKSLWGKRASDGRPDDPHNGQCSVDDVAREYRGAA